MFLHEIKSLVEVASHQPDVSIKRNSRGVFIASDQTTQLTATGNSAESAADQLYDVLLSGGHYDEDTVEDAIRTALTVYQHEQMDDIGIQDERDRPDIDFM